MWSSCFRMLNLCACSDTKDPKCWEAGSIWASKIQLPDGNPVPVKITLQSLPSLLTTSNLPDLSTSNSSDKTVNVHGYSVDQVAGFLADFIANEYVDALDKGEAFKTLPLQVRSGHNACSQRLKDHSSLPPPIQFHPPSLPPSLPRPTASVLLPP